MRNKLAVFSFALILSVSLPALAESDYESKVKALNWQYGPTTIPTVGDASIFVPQGYGFLDGSETRKFDVINENPPGSEVENTIAPNDLRWGAFLSFDPVGYVKDDEKIDADSILRSFKDGTEEQNVERKKNGWAPLHVIGWKYPPHYDNTNHRLVWALELQNDNGDKSINYNERILGRRGVTSALLVSSPEDLDASVKEFEALIAGYQFSPGNTYAEFRAGDHIAEFGLGALILGGGAAAVAKSGAAKGLFKFILLAGAAVFAGIIGFFKKLFGGSTK